MNSLRPAARFTAAAALTAALLAFGIPQTASAADAPPERGWSSPIALTTSAFWDVSGPTTISLPNGGLVATWRNGSYPVAVLESSHSADGGLSWSAPTLVHGSGNNADARLVVTGDAVVAVWTSEDVPGSTVLSSTSADGGATWSPAIAVSDSGNSSNARVTASATGGLTAVWMNSNANGGQVQSSTSSDGGLSWTTPVDLSTAADARTAEVATDADGSVTAVWNVGAGDTRVIQSALSVDGGSTWTAATDLAGSNGGEYPQIVVDGDGVLTTVWICRNVDGETVVDASSSSDGGVNWTAPTTLSIGTTNYSPTVAVGPTGAVTAAWAAKSGTNQLVQSSHSTDGGATWSPAIDLTSSGRGMSPQLVVDQDGVVTAAWAIRASGSFIQSSRSTDAGATWTAPVNAASFGIANEPKLAVDTDGRVAAVWINDLSDDSASDIRAAFIGQAAAFTSAAPPTATKHEPYSYQLAATGDPAPTYVVSEGALPAGLTLDSATGLISGTPTATGDASFTVTASNGIGTAATADYALTVVLSAPVAAPSTALTPAQEDGISLDRTSSMVGGQIVVSVPSAGVGDQVSVWLHSTPTSLGDWFTVSSDHTVAVLLPADVELGVHRVVVQNEANEVVGWSTITIIADPGTEPGPGTEPNPGTAPGGDSEPKPGTDAGTKPATDTVAASSSDLAETGFDMTPVVSLAGLLLAGGLALALRECARSRRGGAVSARS